MRLIRSLKEWAKRHWPALPLRTILFGTLLFVAALPGFGAVFLRVYENTIVQQTEAELIAQGAVLAAAYKAAWNGDKRETDTPPLAPEPPQIDLRTMRVLPPGTTNPADHPADPAAIAVARQLQPITNDSGAVTLAAVRLLDRDGIVVLGKHDIGQSYADDPEVGLALKGRSATVLRQRQEFRDGIFWESISRAATIRVHHARPVIAQGKIVGVVLLSRSPRGLLLGIYQDRGKIALGVALIFGTLVLLVALLSRGIARPIIALTRATERVAQGSVEMGSADMPETPTTAASEIQELFDNFRIMADRIAVRSRYLRDFATAVSHEFKTPIAGIRGALELLDDHWATMDAEERRRFIANASADAERLQRLTDRLLDLARADMTRGDSDTQADLIAIARRVVTRFGALDVSIASETNEIAARIAPQVFETVLDTLVTNSLQAGAHKVGIAIRPIGDEIAVTVRDDGPGIPAADAERVFEPFFTGRRDTGGTGLGLSIARSLLAATGGTIAMLPSIRGAAVEIRLARGTA
ncbi:two-component system sensor histidine kinase ChvG [Sphingomonas sp. UYAg733]